MGTASVIVFYGAEIPISENEITPCEERTHPMIRAAREAKLDFYWTDFIPHDEQGYQLLVGRRFGSFGPEDSVEAHIERSTVTLAMDAVDSFLARVGLASPGKLIVRYEQNL